MFEKMIKSYYDLFDRKVQHSTSVVFIISIMIMFVGLIFSSNDILLYSKSSVLDSNNVNIKYIGSGDIISISGVQYRVKLEKLD